MLIPSLEILKDTPLRSFFHLSIILNVRAVPRLRRENHNWRLLKSWKQKVLIHMKPLTIRNITLGEGRPKIIVPIVDRDAQAILDRAVGFVGYQVDLVEWRADFFDRVGDAQAVEQVLKGLRERLPDKLLLFTFRTRQEGGARDISPEDYLELNRHVAESGRADLIDVEIFRENAAENIRVIHAAGARVVGSNHAFHNTPPHSEILYRLRKAQDMGADIPKIAVMARSPRDVLTLWPPRRRCIPTTRTGPSSPCPWVGPAPSAGWPVRYLAPALPSAPSERAPRPDRFRPTSWLRFWT